MADCQHKRGDWIKEKGYWLCADCFSKMDSRPTRYGPIKLQDPIWSNDAPRVPQGIVWQAEVATADGVTLNDFLRTMARRFMQKTRQQMGRDDAYDAAISVLQSLLSLGDTYGDPAYDWSHEGAREMADEEMTYWDDEVNARNG